MHGRVRKVEDDGGAGERLATWLEEIGLADQLGAAGLPTFRRGADGLAFWQEPGTGEPLTPERLAELDALLHQQGDEPAHAVPVALVQLRRKAAVRGRLLASPWHTYASLAALRDRSENAVRFAVHKAANRGGLLVVVHDDGRTMVPAFQLDDTGELRPELGAVLEPLLTAHMDPWQVWSWLTQPAGLLGGQVPHEAARDPEEVPLVQHAAVRLAERARLTQG
ncbi:MAG TPA: hypothetical protein VGE77_03250 [Nocardioides sp.]